MSYIKTLCARASGVVVTLVIVAGPLQAEEEARIWTNTSGKTVSGILQEKGDDWAKILIKGKVYKLPLNSLSEVDQEYIKNAKLGEDAPMPDEPSSDDPDPKEPEPTNEPDDPKPSDRESGKKRPLGKVPAALNEVVGLKVSEAEPQRDEVDDNSHSPTRLKFEVKSVPESGVHCILVWMASFRGGGGTDVHSTSEDFFPKDGDYYIQELFSNNRQSGASYKGYAVRLLNTKFEMVAEMSSDPTYLEKLNEAQLKIFPGSIPEAEEDE